MRKRQLSMRSQKSVFEIYEEFILSCKVKNLSEYMIAHYERHLKMFFDYCGEISITDLTKPLYDRYILHCQQKQIKEITIQTYVKVIRTFYYYCMDKGYLPSSSLSVPTAERELKEVYTDEGAASIFRRNLQPYGGGCCRKLSTLRRQAHPYKISMDNNEI